MRRFDEDLPIMRRIASTLNENEVSVLLNWYEGVHDRKSRGVTDEQSLNWPEIVEGNLKAVQDADALIIEGSRFNYSQGFQTALALEHGKPVLNLYREHLPEYKEWPDKLFVSGVTHPLFTSKAYRDEEGLDKIVTEFVHNYLQKSRELDVTLALSADDFKRLDLLARNEGKSRTSVIRDILTENLHDR